jgi:stress-induced morphogen
MSQSPRTTGTKASARAPRKVKLNLAGNGAPLIPETMKEFPADPQVVQIGDHLEQRYQSAHPKASITVKRSNAVCIRVRILDPDFAAIPSLKRHHVVWDILDELPDDTANQISLMVLLTPQEAKSSFANLEFENPAPLHD